MERVKQQFNLKTAIYRMIPNVERNCYELYLELGTGEVVMGIGREREFSCLPLSPSLIQWLQRTLIPATEQALADVNIEYAQKRRSLRLYPICLHLMRPGWSEAEYRRKAANHRRDIQYKWKILCDRSTPEDKAAIIITIC